MNLRGSLIASLVSFCTLFSTVGCVEASVQSNEETTAENQVCDMYTTHIVLTFLAEEVKQVIVDKEAILADITSHRQEHADTIVSDTREEVKAVMQDLLVLREAYGRSEGEREMILRVRDVIVEKCNLEINTDS